MLGYNTFTVNTLLLLQVLAIGVCGTYFNVCIVFFVCLGYYFRESIARGRRVYDNMHTTYVLFIVMCCGVSFALQSISLSSASRNLALAKRPTSDGGTCSITAFDSIDELAARYKLRTAAGAGTRGCGPAAYDRVALHDRYPLADHGDAPLLFGEDPPRLYRRACNHTKLRCFRWCMRLDPDTEPDACFRPAWSMVYNVYMTNARAVHLAVDSAQPRVQAWHEYTHALAGGARIRTRTRAASGLPSFETHIAGVREIDRMPEPYTDEFLVVEPLDTNQPSMVEVRVRARCVPGSRVCMSGVAPSASVSVSASVAQLAQGAAIAPYTIVPVVAQCHTSSGTHCELSLGALLVAHVLNTLVLVASIYIALLTHALDTQTQPVKIVLATTCVFSLNWVGLLSLGAAASVRGAAQGGLCRVLLGVLQIAQLSVLVYELHSVDFAHNGLLEAYAREDTRWTFWVLAPATLLHGPVYFMCCVLGAAATGVLFLDSLRLVRLYERV